MLYKPSFKSSLGAMTDFLKINYEEETLNKLSRLAISENYEHRNQPFANTPVFEAHLEDFQSLTQGHDVKNVYQLKLVLKGIRYNFLPGDVVAILPENDEDEVKAILTRLNLNNVCHKRYSLEVLKNTGKRKAAIPKHLPQSGTLYSIFLKYIDVRTVPKKTFLKNLAQYTKDSVEKERLQLLCSSLGSNDYAKLITNHRNLLSLLNSFPSCHPPVELILEYSSPLNPRYFSISSFSTLASNNISIIFSVLELENGLKGVCTGWLQKIVNDRELKTKAIPMYFRKPGNFRLTNTDLPKILVAAGTGLAPFLSFLEYKSCERVVSATTWLFYGCRYSTRDFLCREQVTSYVDNGVLSKLCTAFSREGVKKEYVQSRIVEHKEEITDLILNKGGSIFICGDAKTLVKDVKDVILKCFMECKNVDEDILNRLTQEGRFCVDSWI